MLEKRKHKRIDAKIRVTFSTLDELVSEYTHNISLGGIFIKTNRLLDPNAYIELEMVFPDGEGTFTVNGKVVRLMSMSHPTEPNQQLHGVGLKFMDPPQEMLTKIEHLIGKLSP